MKPIKSLIVLAIVIAPGLAAAQGYYGGPAYGPPPLPGGFHNRAGGLAIGGSVGIGYMNDNGKSVDCSTCDINPATGELDLHIGPMINARTAILFEMQFNVQQIAYDPTQDVTLSQSLFMGAVQWWATPQLWLKGGIGVGHLDVNDNINGTYAVADTGLGLMGGAGFEILSARNFALDLQLRIAHGQYTGSGDSITSGTVGIGINWY